MPIDSEIIRVGTTPRHKMLLRQFSSRGHVKCFDSLNQNGNLCEALEAFLNRKYLHWPSRWRKKTNGCTAILRRDCAVTIPLRQPCLTACGQRNRPTVAA